MPLLNFIDSVVHESNDVRVVPLASFTINEMVCSPEPLMVVRALHETSTNTVSTPRLGTCITPEYECTTADPSAEPGWIDSLNNPFLPDVEST